MALAVTQRAKREDHKPVLVASTGAGRVEGFPVARSSRYVAAIVVAAIGVGVSILTWTRALEERQIGIANVMGSLADETVGTIEFQLDREVSALRGMATFWQLHGVMAERPWSLQTLVTIEQYPGVQWVAWLPPDTSNTRFLARDPAVRLDPAVLSASRVQRVAPAAVIREQWDEAMNLHVFLPVGSPRESIGVLAAAIRVDSLWLKTITRSAGNLSVKLTSVKGHELVLKPSASDAPRWSVLRRAFTSPAGSSVQVELVPRPEFLQHMAAPWPHYFLLTGIFLSVALSIVLFQFQRSRDYTEVLAQANQDLDRQLAELSRRDRELNELNADLEKRVRSRTEELTNALHEVETFSHSVSHDLRTPIGAILNFTAVVEDEYGPRLDDEGRRLLERIRAAGLRANQLLSALMEYATSGVSLHQPTVLDMKALATGGCAEVMGREGAARDIQVTVGDLPPAFADPVQVHRVFVNLIGNAVQYARGQPPSEVQVGGDVNGTECIYWVRDNGPGFDPSLAAGVFDPFRRPDGAIAAGARLGLAMVAKIVRRQGGRVRAESDGKSGATFYFTLPMAGGRNGEGSGDPPRR